jgi:hypothetical protein
MLGSIEVFNPGRSQRAVLSRAGAQPGVRTALWVALGPAPLPAGHCFDGAAGFWLAESMDGLVGCHASARPPNGRSVGGRVVHDLPSLDPGGAWLRELAQALASAPGARAAASAEHHALGRAVAAFCAELDPDVLAAVREEEAATPAAYNHYRQSGERPRRNRLQAALSHPRFATALRLDWRLRRAVDSGAELTPCLATHFQVGAATIRRTRRLARECFPAGELPQVLKYADALPAPAMPTSPADWAVYRRLADGLDTLARLTGIGPSKLLHPFLGGWASGLAEIERRLQAPLDLDAILETMHCAYHYGVRPAVAAASAQAGREVALAASPPAGFFPLWFGRYGLVRLAEIAQQWKEAHGRFSLERLAGTRAGNRAAPLAWPALLDAGASHGGLRVVELTSRAALELEGRRLRHCVASYAIKCLLAESAIFSIRDPAGAPLSTFEVRVPADGPPELLRHHAAANAAPGEHEQAVARRFVERVLAPLPRAHVGAVQQARRELGLRVRALLGKPDTIEQPLTEDELGRLGEAIAIAHPAEARRMGVVAFLEEKGPAVLSAMGAGSLLSVVALSA